MGYKILNCERDDTYRYSLNVKTDCTSNKKLVVIQCNPSVANEGQSDPTAGKVSLWAEENLFSEITFLNLFAYISPHTSDLKEKDYSFLVGSKNDATLKKYISSETTIVLAWGGDVPIEQHLYIKRLNEVKNILDDAKVIPYKVGALSYGTHPRHGRMWNKGNRELSQLNWNEILV